MKRIVVMQDNLKPYIDKFKSVAPDWEIIAKPEQSAMASLLPEAEVVLAWSKEVKDLCVKNPSSLRWFHA